MTNHTNFQDPDVNAPSHEYKTTSLQGARVTRTLYNAFKYEQ